jgi:hypothetical protein
LGDRPGLTEASGAAATAEMAKGGTMPKWSVIRPSVIVEKASEHIISV